MVHVNEKCVFCNRRFKLPVKKSRMLKAKHNGEHYDVCEFHYTMLVNNWDNQAETMKGILEKELTPPMNESKFVEEWNKACDKLKIKPKKKEVSWIWKS